MKYQELENNKFIVEFDSEDDKEQTFLGETTVDHVNKLSWADENKKAQERLEKKQQLEKRNTQKAIEKTEKTEQVKLFEDFFGGN